MKWMITLTALLIMMTSCTLFPTQVADMKNPASAYCEEQGNTLVIHTDADGSQRGICIFPDGTQCDEWAYFRGECGPGSSEPTATSPETGSDEWLIYQNADFGYRFSYPAGAEILPADNPLNSLTISGPAIGNETWVISHPSDRTEYRPPEGADLLQWLTDHALVGEKRAPDLQIAGTTAIHFRHDRSPQSYADDRYFFARAGQLYMVLIGHSSDQEDWELINRFLQGFQFDE